MRRVLLAAASVAIAVSTTARLPARAFQADPVPAFITDLESALASGDPARLRALESPDLAAAGAAVATHALAIDNTSAVAVRSRTHKTTGTSTEILADVFVGHGPRARSRSPGA